MKHEFIDAQASSRHNPKTFWAPGEEELNKLKVGDKVKVCAYSERFWVKISKVAGNKITAIAIAGLCLRDEIKKGDKITFEKKHIYNIL